MAEMKFNAAFGDQEGDARPVGSMIVGALLVAAGVALLAERTNLLPASWRLLIWPILLMAVGVGRLAIPARRGRRGLFFVLTGAWWFAGLQGWLAFDRTWPLLIVFYGASVVLQGVTAQPGLPQNGHRRRHSSGMSWAVLAILAGAFLASGGPKGWTRTIDDNGRVRLMAIMGRSDHHLRTDSFKDGETFTLMARNVIDLRDLPAGAPADLTLDGFTAMGNTTVRVPDTWTVDVQAVAVMGRTRDRRDAQRTPTDWSGGSSTATPPSADASSGAPSVSPAAPRRLVVRGLVLMGELAITN